MMMTVMKDQPTQMALENLSVYEIFLPSCKERPTRQEARASRPCTTSSKRITKITTRTDIATQTKISRVRIKNTSNRML